jgi:hypothetical protein
MLTILAIVIGIGIGAITVELRRVGETLKSLKDLLVTEFNKEDKYHKDAARAERDYDEWFETTRGLADPETAPRRPRPPGPPGVMEVADRLGYMDSHLTQQLSSIGGRLESLEKLLSAEFNKEANYYEEAEIAHRKYENSPEGYVSVEDMPVYPRRPAIVEIAKALGAINWNLAGLTTILAPKQNT